MVQPSVQNLTPENKFWLLNHVLKNYQANYGLCVQFRRVVYKYVGSYEAMVDMQPVFNMIYIAPPNVDMFSSWWPFPPYFVGVDERLLALRKLVEYWKELANNKAIKPTKEI